MEQRGEERAARLAAAAALAAGGAPAPLELAPPDDAGAKQAELDHKLFVLGLTVANGYEEDAGVCVGLCRQSWREGFLLTSAMHEAGKRARKVAAAWTGPSSATVPKQGTRLHFAASHGRVDRVRVLLQSGAAVNSRDGRGATPLYSASERGHTAVVTALLATPGIAVNAAATTYGYTPLFIAADLGHLAVVAALLAAPDVAVNAASTGGDTPLIAASSNGHAAVVVALLAAPGVSVNSAKNGFSPLHFASYNGRTAIVSALLAHPAIDVNPRTSGGSTPLRLASTYGLHDIAALLEARGGVE